MWEAVQELVEPLAVLLLLDPELTGLLEGACSRYSVRGKDLLSFRMHFACFLKIFTPFQSGGVVRLSRKSSPLREGTVVLSYQNL